MKNSFCTLNLIAVKIEAWSSELVRPGLYQLALIASQITHSSESLTTVEVSLHFDDLNVKHFQMFPYQTKCATGPFRQELSCHNSAFVTVVFRAAGFEVVTCGEPILQATSSDGLRQGLLKCVSSRL